MKFISKSDHFHEKLSKKLNIKAQKNIGLREKNNQHATFSRKFRVVSKKAKAHEQ